jgi:hypothetical protein
VRLGDSKVLVLGARYPGLVEKVDAMFDEFATIKAVEAMIQADYGEHIGHSTICNYKSRIWKARRKRERAIRAATIAIQELISERRD